MCVCVCVCVCENEKLTSFKKKLASVFRKMNKAIYRIGKEMGAGANADEPGCFKCIYCGLHFRDLDRLLMFVIEHMELYHSGIYQANPKIRNHIEYVDDE